MDKTNLELFKQALSEGLSNKIDSIADSYTEEIVCSEKHNLAMRAIVYGKADAKRVWTPKMKRIIALLVAAALILTSCAIIYRHEIREVIEKFFVKLTYSDNDSEGTAIEDVYELTYVPEGYYLEEESIITVNTRYIFSNSNGNEIQFDQCILDGTSFVVDIESGYNRIVDIQKYEIYYRYTDDSHHYIWNDGKYSMKIKSSEKLSNAEIESILDGIIIK